MDFGKFSRIWALFDASERRQFWWVALIVSIAAVAAAMMILSITPFLSVLSNPSHIHSTPLLAWAYDAGGFESDDSFLIALGLGSVSVIIVANLLQFMRLFAITRFASMRIYSLSCRLMARYLCRPYTFFLNRHTGDLGKQILAESQLVVDQAVQPALHAFAALVTTTMIALTLLFLEPVILLIASGVIILVYGGVFVTTRRWVTRLGKTRAEANTARFRIASEAMSGIKEIRLLGREQHYLDTYSAPAKDVARSQNMINFLLPAPQIAMHTVVFAGIIVLCLALIIRSGSEGGIAEILPTLGLLAFAGQRLLPELSSLFHSAAMLSYSEKAVQGLYDDLVSDSSNLLEVPSTEAKPIGLKQALRFEAVSFRYPQADHAGLERISFEIQAGERIGIVGTTGSGKTTLGNLMLGLLAPSEGQIVVDGTPLSAPLIRAWQRSLGYVPQDIFLTDQTLRENIAFGRAADQIDEDRVIAAAKTAHIHDFILSEMPQGYNTKVGERGVRLSGGQRQRIGIARAMYSNADLLLLDEATSALDSATENKVMQAIDALPGDKTLVMIAHRLSTLRSCNKILMLDKGEIVGFDSWDRLERDCPAFTALAASSEHN